MPFTDFFRSYDANRPELAPYGLECDRWQPVLMNKPDRHNEIEINYVINNSLTYFFKDKKVRIDANTFAVFWALFPHQIIDFESDQFYYTLTIPFKKFMQFDWPSNFVNGLIAGQIFLCEGISEAIETNAFERWFKDLNKKDIANERVALLELYARIFRIAHTVSTQPQAAISGSGRGDFSLGERMAVFIASNYTNNISNTDIAESVDLHPDYANRLFKKSFGQTLKDFLTEQRIMQAQRLLLSTNSKVIDVAFASGFNSLSRFNSTFLEYCHTTPSEFRRSFGFH